MPIQYHASAASQPAKNDNSKHCGHKCFWVFWGVNSLKRLPPNNLNLASSLAADGVDLSRRALEAFGLEEYKKGRLTENGLRRLLGFTTRYQLDGFLKAHEVWIDYTMEDFRREIPTSCSATIVSRTAAIASLPRRL